MKARVKATGEIVEVVYNGFYYESIKDERIFDKSELEDIKTYGGYKITFAKSNRGTAYPNEVEIIANTAYPDMDIAQSIITQTIVIYEHKLRALRMSLMAIENTMK